MLIRRLFRTCILFCALSAIPAFAHPHHDHIPAASADMAKAAQNLLASLSAEQLAQATFKLGDIERFNWHFIPRVRKGLPLKAMTPAQKNLAHALLASGLSQRGYVSAVTIMSLEQVLADMENGRGPHRDPENYSISIFGQPAPDGTWGWRLEGHHISLNFTLIDGHAIASAPAFMGSNPAEVQTGPRKGLRVLDQEEDLGRELMKSLSNDQRQKAIILHDAPREIITGNARKVALTRPVGIGYRELNDAQRKLMMNLISVYAHRLRPEIADQTLARIAEVGEAKIYFGWAGGIEPGQPHYYRIHGPTFLVEFDDTQDHANHIHTVWRDLEHDFGEDLLEEHYRAHHHDN